MREDILDCLQKEVYRRCQKETNKFGMGCYYHIAAVVKNAEILSERYGANREIVMIAAWLHDIASVTDYDLYELHHIHGAEMAYVTKGMDIEEGKEFVKAKLIRSFKKLSADSKKYYQSKFEKVMEVLN